jgi:T5SS/PEP-CTERM-associated repeat protein
MYVGYNQDNSQAGSTGAISVSGSGAQLNSSSTIYVGNGMNSVGTLDIKDGGHVTLTGVNGNGFLLLGNVASSQGTVTVDGYGSQLNATQASGITVGESGAGTLQVTSGGQANVGYITMANTRGSQGTALVSGAGSVLASSGEASVGVGGRAYLNVQDGGHVNAHDTYVGRGASGQGTVNVTGAGSEMNSANNSYIGYSATGTNIAYGGTLNISDGGQANANNTYVGYNSGSTGAVTVSGLNAVLWSSNNTVIGNSGTGTMAVQNDDDAFAGNNTYLGFNTGSTGSATISGGGSSLNSFGDTIVGNSGYGRLTVQDHGIAIAQNTHVGYNASGEGWAFVDGAGSQLISMENTYVGDSGVARVYVQSGGLATAQNTHLGASSTGDGAVIVDGTGSTLQSAGTTVVGEVGAGFVRVQNGGLATATNTVVGASGGSFGWAIVDGSKSRLESSGATMIGNSGFGELDVQNGGTATAHETFIAANAGSYGTVNITGAGSTLQTTNLYVGGNAAGPGGIGVVNVNQGGSVVINAGGNAVVWSTGTLNLDGNLVNNGSFTNAGGTINLGSNAVLSGSGTYNVSLAIVNGTTLSPGNSPGAFTFNGDQTWGSGGQLNWQIVNPTGTPGADWDSININGNLALTATSADPFLINLATISSPTTAGLLFGFDPSHSYEWLFVNAGSITGFDPSEFFIATSGFWNSFTGTFSVRSDGTHLYLDYNAPDPSPAPLPSSLAMLASLAAPGLVMRAIRRRNRPAPAKSSCAIPS